jgi:hypothetical protein
VPLHPSHPSPMELSPLLVDACAVNLSPKDVELG